MASQLNLPNVYMGYIFGWNNPPILTFDPNLQQDLLVATFIDVSVTSWLRKASC